MKVNKIIAGIMAVCAMGFGVPYVNTVAENNSVIMASAVDYTEGTHELLTYKNYGDYIRISGCDTSATEIIIPSEIEGVPVTSINSNAFYYCSSLTSVTIPDSITSIGEWAFAGCSRLKSVEIPDSVTSIEDYAFTGCIGLKSVTIPDSVTHIRSGAFYYCSSLKSVTIPDSVISIEQRAFEACENLGEITILNPECAIANDKLTISSRHIEFSTGESYEFDGTIYGYDNSTAQAYAKKYKCRFISLGTAPGKETSTGDMNGDNSVSIADAVILQECILGRYALTEEQLKSADINGDGFVDSFDLAMLKRRIADAKTIDY